MKRITTILTIVCISYTAGAQQIDLNDPKSRLNKKNLLKMSGGLSASTIFYNGNEAASRDPWNYFLQGNINFNILGLIDLPFSFNFTNSGANHTYPTMPNRLSLHPTYKFLTGHIGDVAMSFSPYTLNGHRFTGVGLDINSTKPLKISAMYGRLQKAVEADNGSATVKAAYQRMGGGLKLRYEQKSFQLAMSLFSAKDEASSLVVKPDSLNILPEQNIAGSISGNINLLPNMQLSVEYGISQMERDIRDAGNNRETYHAIRSNLNYTFRQNTVGIGYERIDPDYKSLGAYYFNNDLENITLNYARPFFENKANIAISAGLQHDDLKNRNESKTSRFVFSADASYTHSEKLNFSGSYTTFQTHQNLRSQFDYINELTPYDNLDTLNFTQLSQNVNLNTSFIFGNNDRKQQLNLMLSYQEAADKQGDIIPEGAVSLFYNASFGYGLQIVPKNINFNLSLNGTQNRMSSINTFIVGPTAAINCLFFDKKLSSGISASYNTSYSEDTKQNEVWNLRFNSAYTLLKKHNISLSAIYRNNSTLQNALSKKTNGITVTAGYNYRF